MRNSFKIGKIFGIDIEMHITFLLLVIIFIMQGKGFFSAMIVLFTFVLFHELSHSYLALKYGVKIKKILLLPIGGVAVMENIPRDPRKEIFISLAGPLSNYFIAFLILIFSNIVGLNVLKFDIYSQLFKEFSIENLVLFAFWINILLATFNLFIPAYPMDGGRILRALLAMKMSYYQATEIAVNIGRTIAIFMIIFGIFYSIFLILIGFFIYVGASAEISHVSTEYVLKGIKAEDIMTKQVIMVDEDATLSELYEIILKTRHMGYPVVKDSKVVGMITFGDLSKIPKEKWGKIRIGEIMSRKVIYCSPETEVIEIVRTMNTEGIGRILVIKENRIEGIISKTDIVRAMQIARLKIYRCI